MDGNMSGTADKIIRLIWHMPYEIFILRIIWQNIVVASLRAQIGGKDYEKEHFI